MGRYKPFCDECYDVMDKLHEYSYGTIVPQMLSLRLDTSRPERKRDAIISTSYITIDMWLQTFHNLNHSYDFQAVGAGARAVFERYLDLMWFEKFPDPNWLDCYAAFPDVDRYLSAKKVVQHVKDTAASKIDPRPFTDFMAKVDAREPFEDLVVRLWGRKPNGTPNRPIFHWTGIRDISERAGKIGPGTFDAYRQLYPAMSWLVHSGPTSFWGRDADHIEMQVGWCYFFAFQHAWAAAKIAIEILNIKIAIPRFDHMIDQLGQWHERSLATLKRVELAGDHQFPDGEIK